MHSTKKGITVLNHPCLITGKRTSMTKLYKWLKTKNWKTDYHVGQSTDVLPVDAFKDSCEICLWKQVSTSAKMLRTALPSAALMRIFSYQKMSRLGSAICPIHQATRYSQHHKRAHVNELLDSTLENGSKSSNDVVIHRETILRLLRTGIVREKHILRSNLQDNTAESQDNSDGEMMDTVEILSIASSHDTHSQPDSTKRKKKILVKRKINPQIDKRLFTVSWRSQPGTNKALNSEIPTTRAKLLMADEIKATESVISTATTYKERKSEPADLTSAHIGHKPVTPREDKPTVLDDLMGKRKEFAETECTTEIEISTQEDIKPEKRETTTYKDIKTEPVDLTLEHIEHKDTNERVTSTPSREHDPTIINHVIGTTTEFAETDCTTGIEISTPEDIRHMEKETTTHKERKTESVDLSSKTPSREHDPTVIDHVIGTTTEFAETECTTEIEISTPENIRHVEGETTTYKENVKFTSENIDQKKKNEQVTPTSLREHEPMVIDRGTGTTTEFAETECTTEIEISTPEDIRPVEKETTTYKESKTESVDLTSETASREHDPTVIDQVKGKTTEFAETERTTDIEISTPENIRHMERETTTFKENVKFTSENIDQKYKNEQVTPTSSREHEPMVIDRGTGTTTEFAETECTTEIEISTPEDIRHMEKETTTYKESKTESVDLSSETPSRELDPTVIDHVKGKTTEFAETERTTEIEISTPENIRHVERETTTFKENVKLTSGNIEEKNKNEPVTPTSLREHEPMVIDRGTGTTTEFAETECTTEIEISTPEDIKPVEKETTTYKESKTESVDLSSETLSRELDPTVIDHVTGTTTEFTETECTTEIEISIPENVSPVVRETTTITDMKSESVDLTSKHSEPKRTDESVTSSTLRQYENIVTLPDHVVEITTEPSETECTTEILTSTPEPPNNRVTTLSAYINSITLAGPERTLDITEYTKDSESSQVKKDNILERTSMKTTEMMPTVTDTGVKTECTEVTEILQSPEEDEMLLRDEDGCFGLIHRTTSGLKRCREKIMQMISYKTTPRSYFPTTLQPNLTLKIQESLQAFFKSFTQLPQKNIEKENQTSDANSHFYYFNGKLKRVGNHAARHENNNKTG
ncbi:hypothetical protein E1301_Tti011646 [Triplophysa tibetana]|uniref:Uncharacterized protein n=1 Tax=Triplophysa tibetana TaxID=1572043 RepID=A0A5A9PGV9_9TELE|nr:hypothetical protein E1301_Tti011646 [Triplophysa tibetana]